MPLVISGADHSNLPERAMKWMQELDLQCRDGAYVHKCVRVLILAFITITVNVLLL